MILYSILLLLRILFHLCAIYLKDQHNYKGSA